MVFDITCLSNQIQENTIRLKPKNKIQCSGVLKVGTRTIASLSHLAIAYHPETQLVGGRFQLEWHRMQPTEACPVFLDIEVLYQQLNLPDKHWYIKEINIIKNGIPFVPGHINELLGGEISFFAKSMNTTGDI